MNFDIGYHVVERGALEEGETFDDEMSVVEFLRRVEHQGEIPYDITVHGLDSYLRGADDPLAVCDHIHRLLTERVNMLTMRSPIIQFVVSEVEHWEEPVIPNDDDDIPLNAIFSGSLVQEGAGWYSSNLNITS